MTYIFVELSKQYVFYIITSSTMSKVYNRFKRFQPTLTHTASAVIACAMNNKIK